MPSLSANYINTFISNIKRLIRENVQTWDKKQQQCSSPFHPDKSDFSYGCATKQKSSQKNKLIIVFKLTVCWSQHEVIAAMHSTVYAARMPLGLSMESSAVKAVFQVSSGVCGFMALWLVGGNVTWTRAWLILDFLKKILISIWGSTTDCDISANFTGNWIVVN